MIWDRASLKNIAKSRLQQNYGSSVLVAFIIMLVMGIFAGVTGNQEIFETTTVSVTINLLGLILATFITNIFIVGGCRFFIENRDYTASASKIFFGFQCGKYGNLVWTMFLRDIKIVLWGMLFVIPGVVKSYEYRMIPYILAEQPDLPSTDAFAISKEMMMGYKMEAFILDVSFFLWWIFSAVTCGIGGIFWTLPYIHGTNAEFYVMLRDSWSYRQHMGNPYEANGETF